MSQNEQTTLTSILRVLIFLRKKYSTLYTCIQVIHYIMRIDITYYYSIV